MTIPETDPSVGPLVREFFREQSPPEVVTATEGTDLAEDLWQQTDEMGLPGIGIDEEAGGSGGSILDLVEVLKAQGAHAAPLPIAESHLARWVAARTGAELDGDRLSVLAPGEVRDSLSVTQGRASGTLHDVRWARAAATVVAPLHLEGALQVLALPTGDATITPGLDLAGQPKDAVTLDDIEVSPLSWDGSPHAVRHRALLLRGAQMAGALEAVSDTTRRYATERVQFGRPIAKFQAVQEHLVRLEQMATMSLVAVDRAARAHAVDEGSLEPALMKLVVNENARLAVRAAHQAHGAIGMTQEYPLQLLTRRLNSWLGEWGTSDRLATAVGQQVASTGISALITRRAGTLEVADA